MVKSLESVAFWPDFDRFFCSNNFNPSVPALHPDTHAPRGLTRIRPSWLDHLKKAIFYRGLDENGRAGRARRGGLAHRSPLGRVRTSYLDLSDSC